LPPARTHFCTVVARTYGRFSTPVKTFLNCTMPALVNISVGSLRGTSGEERTTVWPLPSKKVRNFWRISEAFMSRGAGVSIAPRSIPLLSALD
jgi:hypothetical protein